MDETIQIDINLNKVPENVGTIEYINNKTLLKNIDIPAMKTWIFDKLPEVENITFLIHGPMPNFIGIQLGIWLGPLGKIVYKSPTGFTLELDSVV